MPAEARESADRDSLTTYVVARAADAQGDPATAARLYAGLVREMPGEEQLRRRAIGEAIEAGDMPLALQLSRPLPIDQTALDVRLLLVAEQLHSGHDARALEILRTKVGMIDSSFLAPFVEAWTRADKRDGNATASLNQVPDASPLAPLRDEHRAMILLKLKRPAEALPLAQSALGKAGGRAERLRLAFADGFVRAGDKVDALKMLDGGDTSAMADSRARIAAGKPLGQSVDSATKAFGELLLGLSLALSKMDNKALPISLAQVARYANPSNSAGTLLLALLLESDDRTPAALGLVRTIAPGDPFAAQAQDAEVRILNADGRKAEALARAQVFAASAATADSLARLGAALSENERYPEAAEVYGRALTLAAAQPGDDTIWALHLFRASALESAEHWDEAKAEIALAMKLSPDNPLLLNFLGYGQLERGENLDAAEAMVKQANALRPDDASITDSLGWAQHKRGRTAEAIATLQRAADGDPAQAEIHEHLGDALYTAGRRIEARFAWRAALVAADDDKAKEAPRRQAGARADHGQRLALTFSEIAPAKLNLALHVRGKLPDGRHALETLFAFCTDGDRLDCEAADDITLEIDGPFAAALSGDNLVLTAANALKQRANVRHGAALRLVKNLPVASGIGGGSADAAAALRGVVRLWGIDPAHATAVAPGLGADVPACLLSLTARGEGAGDQLDLIADDPGIAGSPVLLVNPPPAAVDRRGVRRVGRGRSRPAWRLAKWSQRSRSPGAHPRSRDRRHPRLARRAAWRDLHPHAGQRRDLLCPVRGRSRARCRCCRLSRAMVASGDLPALRARHAPPDPHRRPDACRRSGA